MVFQSPGDVLFHIGKTPIYFYGIIMAIACLSGVAVVYKLFKQIAPDKDADKIFDIAAYVLIFGFIGARLYYCLLNPIYYFYNPVEIFNFREGGLSIHGGLIGGSLTLIYLCKKYKLSTLSTLDIFACATPLAQSIGRWGNFFNSEAFGSPTNLPWKLYIPLSHRPEQYMDYQYFHPTFLYGSVIDIIIFIVMLRILNRFAQKYPGFTFCSYIIIYSTARLIIESIRVDSALSISGIPIAKIVSVILIIAGLIGIISIIKKNCEQI